MAEYNMLVSLLLSLIFLGGNVAGVALVNPPRLNFSEHDELHFYVVGGYRTILGPSGNPSMNMSTRYLCWSESLYTPTQMYNYLGSTSDSSNSNSSTYDDIDCGIPGPVWIMYPNNEYPTYWHNYLTGIGRAETADDGENEWYYKDPDVTNVCLCVCLKLAIQIMTSCCLCLAWAI